MKSGLSFLVGALRCEIDELAELAHTSELVDAISQLVHGLQRERGLSNVWLGSGGKRFGAERHAQVTACGALQVQVRERFDQLGSEARRPGNGARLFSRIAWVLPGLDALPELRRRIDAQQIDAQQIDAAQASAAFAKLIAGLLAVVFEAADGATDPLISRRLVALFNFMQGKEFAGQERACGAAAFSAGHNDGARQQQWLQLIAAQERCFQLFAEFSDAAVLAAWQERQPSAQAAELERLRRIACAAPAGGALDTELTARWFDCSTARIDAMHSVEERLTSQLHQVCENRIAQARAELQSHESLLDILPCDDEPRAAAAFFDVPAGVAPAAPSPLPGEAPAPFGRHLERSILDLVQEQSTRLQSMNDELDTVRAALNERKLVERAKGLLMAHRRLSEQDAHKLLRQTAMNQNRRLVDVAESVLSMADLLPGEPAA